MDDAIVRESEALLAIWNGEGIRRGQFFGHVMQVAETLPKGPCVMNLCDDRYVFTVVLVASAVCGKTNLLPPNRANAVIEEIAREYGNPCAVVDREDFDCPVEKFVVRLEPGSDRTACLPAIDPEHVAVTAFTSGSTGRPIGHPKAWTVFAKSAQMALKRLDLARYAFCVVATTPPQHMFGLETSVFWPLFSHLVLTGDRPFFPEDIRRALAGAPLPSLLVSTPTHLKACTASGGEWRNVALALCSTAPLTAALAARVESLFPAPLWEIFGSTETLSYASRRTAKSSRWQLYDGALLRPDREGFVLHSPHLDQPTPLEDVFKLLENHCFSVSGRSTDIVKVAGKRCSMQELNHRLNGIDGVTDGYFFTAEVNGTGCRVGALVVTHLSRENILNNLKKSIDEVFLPRPLHIVDKIPRNEVDKLVKSELDRLLEELKVERAF
ncbi:MAG: AMP-binding protein [Pseudomonadota bacterium]